MEGPSDEPHVRALRERQKRNLLATLLFSQGVPMLVAGDEMGRTQRGNNNAYCQDSELSWVDWDLDADGRGLLEFVRALITLRNRHPLFRRRTYFRGRAVRDPDVKDIVWLNSAGMEMTDQEWTRSTARCLGVLISGGGLTERDEHGRPVEDDDVLVLLNAHAGQVDFPLPGPGDERWRALVDTQFDDGRPPGGEGAAAGAGAFPAGTAYPLQGRSVALLTRPSTSGRARTDA